MFFYISVLLCFILSIKRLNPLGKLLLLMVQIVLDIFDPTFSCLPHKERRGGRSASSVSWIQCCPSLERSSLGEISETYFTRWWNSHCVLKTLLGLHWIFLFEELIWLQILNEHRWEHTRIENNEVNVRLCESDFKSLESR